MEGHHSDYGTEWVLVAGDGLIVPFAYVDSTSECETTILIDQVYACLDRSNYISRSVGYEDGPAGSDYYTKALLRSSCNGR